MSKRVFFGMLAALGAAGVAGDAWANAHKFPMLHKLFDGDWDVARSLLYAISSAMAAVFGYLAINIKGTGEATSEGSDGKEAK
jgi:hypothetical protein